jgi:hypothetical protein
MGSLLILT